MSEGGLSSPGLWRDEQEDDGAWHRQGRCGVCSDAVAVPFCCQKATPFTCRSTFLPSLMVMMTERTRVRKQLAQPEQQGEGFSYSLGASGRAAAPLHRGAGWGVSDISFDCLLDASRQTCSGHGEAHRKAQDTLKKLRLLDPQAPWDPAG